MKKKTPSNSHEYIWENTLTRNKQLAIVTIVAIVLFIVISLLYFNVFERSHTLGAVKDHIASQMYNATPVGLLYAGLLGGLFFFFLPLEILFTLGLSKSHDPLLLAGLLLTGYFTSQVVNFFLGSKFSDYLINLTSKQKFFQVKRWVNKYGGLAVFVINLIPTLPAPVLTFALGVARYNSTRLLVYTGLGQMLKYAFLIWIFA